MYKPKKGWTDVDPWMPVPGAKSTADMCLLA